MVSWRVQFRSVHVLQNAEITNLKFFLFFDSLSLFVSVCLCSSQFLFLCLFLFFPIIRLYFLFHLNLSINRRNRNKSRITQCTIQRRKNIDAMEQRVNVNGVEKELPIISVG